jgi:hypothetical protein
VGTGGFDGFVCLEARAQTQWFKGDHGKPLQRPNLPKIVDYILSANLANPLMPKPTDGDWCPEPSFWFKVKMYLFPPIMATVISSIGFVAWFGWTHGHPGAVILGVAMLYFLLDTI